MNNYGIAECRVVIRGDLPHIDSAIRKYNFDFLSTNYRAFENSPILPPILTEYVGADDGSFGVCFPSRRITNIDNYIVTEGKSPKTTEAHITIKEIETQDGMIKDLFKDFLSHDKEENKPIWENRPHPNQPRPDDKKALSQWFAWMGVKDTETEEPKGVEETPSSMYVHQTKAKDGLWWGVETSPFLTNNNPFWVQFVREGSPTSDDHETCFLISMGMSSPENHIDIFLSNRAKPRIIDYNGGTKDAPGANVEFEVDTATIMDTEPYINVSVMAIGGRLVVHVNNEVLIYTRVVKDEPDNIGTIRECQIPQGPIRIYGTNAQCGINVNPMRFAPYACFAVNIASVQGEEDTAVTLRYQGVDKQGNYRGSVAELPTDPTGPEQLFGVDCASFDGDGGTATPSGTGFHKLGAVTFRLASKIGVSVDLSEWDPYVIVMASGNSTFKSATGKEYGLLYGGAPYVFRLKGGVQLADSGQSSVGKDIDVTDYVISVSETSSAPDYFHVKKNATVVLYNEGGVFDDLTFDQYGIEISWGWDGNVVKTFTGMVVSASTVEVAGREEITLECEDYMFILKNTPIINSPYYDGMIAFYAIKDMAERAGINSVINKWTTEREYFLPSGFSYSQPAMKYPETNMLFDCVMDVIKRFEGFIYFNPNGELVCFKLPGGLFSEEAGGSIVKKFSTDPLSKDAAVILDEKKIDYSFDSTVNVISILSIDRDTRNPIVIAHSAKEGENRLRFKRTELINQGALGEKEVARAWAQELGKRLFYPIRKVGFKTVGTKTLMVPLNFIEVCGLEYRVMSIKRQFQAETNNYIEEYNAEWLGGK